MLTTLALSNSIVLISRCLWVLSWSQCEFLHLYECFVCIVYSTFESTVFKLEEFRWFSRSERSDERHWVSWSNDISLIVIDQQWHHFWMIMVRVIDSESCEGHHGITSWPLPSFGPQRSEISFENCRQTPMHTKVLDLCLRRFIISFAISYAYSWIGKRFPPQWRRSLE